MSNWQQLIKTALVGTDNASFTPTDADELARIGVLLPENDESLRVLQAAAAYSVAFKAGYEPATGVPAALKPAPPDSKPICSVQTLSLLKQAMNGLYQPRVLLECVRLIAQQGKYLLPYEILPELLTHAKNTPDVWAYLLQAMGERGQWLVLQNPDWSYINQTPDDDWWLHGTTEQREILLRHLRQQAPQRALELLQQTWKTDDSTQKVKFVQALLISLSSTDEAFLEQCLDEKKKDVRKSAALLLARIPHSALSKRMTERLTPLVQYKKGLLGIGASVEIHLPEQMDATMERDGIDPRAQWSKGGVKASRLGQMLAIVSPQYWNTHFATTPAAIIKLIKGHEWGELFLEALIEATTLHHNEEWATALMNFWIDNFDDPKWTKGMETLFEVCTPALFNKLAIKCYADTPNAFFEDYHPLVRMLRHFDYTWDDQLSKLLITSFFNWMGEEKQRYWGGYHYKTILKKAALNINPTLTPYIQQQVPYESPAWVHWSSDVNDLLSHLNFRLDIRKALTS